MAFLNGNIDCLLYIIFPYKFPNKNKRRLYSLLNSLYELKQAPLLWFKKLHPFLVDEMKHKKLTISSSVFIKRDNNGDMNIIRTFGDDLIFVVSNIDQPKMEVAQFLSRFEGTAKH